MTMATPHRPEAGPRHEVSIVVPVYKGETTLDALVAEILPLTMVPCRPAVCPWVVTEVLLVHDNGPDDSAGTCAVSRRHTPWCAPSGLSRNFGHNSATLAGMASTGSEWIATIDEDGQHDPADIGSSSTQPPRTRPHSFTRSPQTAHPMVPCATPRRGAPRRSSRTLAGNPRTAEYQSFRLVLGEVGRSVAAYAGAGVYLDVALGWVASRTATAPIALRGDERRASGYSARSLLGHFWRLILTSGTRGLRIVSGAGCALRPRGRRAGHPVSRPATRQWRPPRWVGLTNYRHAVRVGGESCSRWGSSRSTSVLS